MFEIIKSKSPLHNFRALFTKGQKISPLRIGGHWQSVFSSPWYNQSPYSRSIPCKNIRTATRNAWVLVYPTSNALAIFTPGTLHGEPEKKPDKFWVSYLFTQRKLEQTLISGNYFLSSTLLDWLIFWHIVKEVYFPFLNYKVFQLVNYFELKSKFLEPWGTTPVILKFLTGVSLECLACVFLSVINSSSLK